MGILEHSPLPFGVLQGSILGPLLFILDTRLASPLHYGISIHIHADDTQLHIKLSTADIETSKAKLIACFHDIQSWCAFNPSMLLMLNTTKTELMRFDSQSQSNLGLKTLSLQLNDSCCIQPSNVVV